MAAQMFTLDEVGFFDELLDGFLDGSAEDAHWLVVEESEAVVAAAYYAPEPFADRCWNLYFIAVDPEVQGGGLGSRLIAQIEMELRARGQDEARVLLVETSSTEQYARTRHFYAGLGFTEEARIRQYYGPGDDKVVFWKLLTGPTGSDDGVS